ncbi:hypothetical protein NPIL_17441 [Nephila pilipes]|uniref:Uncharacterized protein n=1 Tax=Nephila pilipes TaxID=299642 RepID=A0A8X6PTA9_NEPPI|nr:hypothetical protein NPIL_17441 [Nephila pilipes]
MPLCMLRKLALPYLFSASLLFAMVRKRANSESRFAVLKYQQLQAAWRTRAKMATVLHDAGFTQGLRVPGVSNCLLKIRKKAKMLVKSAKMFTASQLRRMPRRSYPATGEFLDEIPALGNRHESRDPRKTGHSARGCPTCPDSRRRGSE